MNYSLLHRIAGAGPWLGPVPSAFFIGRSIYLHLLSGWQGGTVKVPPAANLAVAVVCGLVVELLAIVSIHNALALYRWNHTPRVAKDKGGWERAPLWVALLCTGLYILAAVLLLVVLEAWPQLAQYAPILFPLLAVVGALNLAILDQHQDRLERYGLEWNYKAIQDQEAIQRRREERERLAKLREDGICRICEQQVGPEDLNNDGLCGVCQRRKEGKTHTPGTYLSNQVLARDDWRCYYCSERLREAGPNGRHIDHFVPRSVGGEDVLDNLVTSCQACNLSKANKMPSESEVFDFAMYRKAKSNAPDKKSQILFLSESDTDLTQADIARILKTSQGYVSSVLREHKQNHCKGVGDAGQ